MARAENLSIYQGDDYVADVYVFEYDGVTPADLSGYAASSHIRVSFTDNTIYATFETSVTGNKVTIILGHDITASLANTTYVWDLQLTDSSNWITTILAGYVFVTKGVTLVEGPLSKVVLQGRNN